MATSARLVCASAEVAERGDGVRFLAGETPAFVIRFDGNIYGYRNRCAHISVELDWIDGKFFDSEGEHLICSTHGATYDPTSGRCLGGPCRGGLEPLRIFEANGSIYLKEGGDG